MLNRISKFVTASGMAAMLAVGAMPKPASADSQSTINTVLGAAALIGGIVLYNNYEHKKQAANSVVGYTRNGGTVYGDGRIVMPNGQTIYPNANGQYPWGQTAYYNNNAGGYTYDTQRTGRYDTTHRHGNWHATHSYVPAPAPARPVYRNTAYNHPNPAYAHSSAAHARPPVAGPVAGRGPDHTRDDNRSHDDHHPH